MAACQRINSMSINSQSSSSGLVACAQFRSFLLVTGYLRGIFGVENMVHFEQSLSQIIMQLLGNIFVKFDIYPKECDSLIYDNGKCIKRRKGCKFKRFMIGSSYGWYYGVHEISFEVKSSNWHHCGYGVTTNINAFDCDKCVWVGDVKTGYHYALFYGHIAGLEDGYQDGVSFQRNALQFYPELKPEAVDEFKDEMGKIHDLLVEINRVTIRFNGNDWTLTWLLNGKIIGKPLSIMECCTYYPFLGFHFEPMNGDEEYRILL